MSNIKFATPLPEQASRLGLLSHLASTGPQDIEMLLKALQIPTPAKAGVLRRLEKMEKEGIVFFSKNEQGQQQIKALSNSFETIFQGTAKGSGFLRQENGEDAFVDRNQNCSAFQGDTIIAWIIGKDEKGRPLGAVETILKRNRAPWIGTLEDKNGQLKLKSFDKRRPLLSISNTFEDQTLKAGQVVMATLEEHHQNEQSRLEKKEEVDKRDKILKPLSLNPCKFLGETLTAALASEVTKAELELPGEFPDEVQLEIKNLPNYLTGHYSKILDVRELPLVTIDGASSRDFDDAVHATTLPNGGFELTVAIADVSSYVQPGTALDKEALDRGTSVYLPDQVIPMLPEALSNELCSLNPGVDRLCVVCSMKLNEKGQVIDASFKKAVMNSHARLTYTDATQKMESFLEKKSQVSNGVEHNLTALALLQKTLDLQPGYEQRQDRIEYRFRLNSSGSVKVFEAEGRTFSHRVIETCMIMANVAAARHLKKKQQGVFRVHSQPLELRYDALSQTLQEFGIEVPQWENLNKEAYLSLLETVGMHSESKRLTPLTQRLPSSARYESVNGGHFSLGLDAYTHFTSPIRRYPDLLVHRALFDESLELKLDEVLEQCNEKEKRANHAERQVSERWRCSWLEQQGDKTFEGVVTGIRPNGVWVTIENGVEGLLSARDLPEGPYTFDSIRHELCSEKHVFTLGQVMTVHPRKISMGERKIDWGFGPFTLQMTPKNRF